MSCNAIINHTHHRYDSQNFWPVLWQSLTKVAKVRNSASSFSITGNATLFSLSKRCPSFWPLFYKGNVLYSNRFKMSSYYNHIKQKTETHTNAILNNSHLLYIWPLVNVPHHPSWFLIRCIPTKKTAHYFLMQVTNIRIKRCISNGLVTMAANNSRDIIHWVTKFAYICHRSVHKACFKCAWGEERKLPFLYVMSGIWCPIGTQ